MCHGADILQCRHGTFSHVAMPRADPAQILLNAVMWSWREVLRVAGS